LPSLSCPSLRQIDVEHNHFFQGIAPLHGRGRGGGREGGREDESRGELYLRTMS
jgi:hypothetical protein